MAGVKVSYQVVGEQGLRALTGLDLRLRDLTPVLRDFAGYMEGSVQKNFEAQGRPVRWRPLKMASLSGWLASRRSWGTGAGLRALHGRLILTDTGRLRNSIHFQVLAGGRGVEGFTNVKYAAIQQLGGSINIPAFGPRKKKALFWPGALHPVRRVAAHAVTIPARPFLMFQEQEDIYGYLYPRTKAYVEEA
jgi:phage gpG-like protein